MRKHAHSLLIAMAVLATLGSAAAAQDWNPFDPFANDRKREEERKRAQEERDKAKDDSEGDTVVPQAPAGDAFSVERSELTPVMATDGSGLPYELWQGLDVAKLEGLIAEIEIPPRSPALHALWLRLITSNVTRPAGGATDQQFMALRLETLYRSGLLEKASQELANETSRDALVATLAARNEIGQGKKIEGCATAQSGGAPGSGFPKHLRGQAALISGYCAAVAEDAAGAGLAAEMAREEGLAGSAGVRALDAVAAGSKPKLAADQPISLLDYRLLEVAGAKMDTGAMLKQAAPSLLAALALDPNSPAELKLAAAENAAHLNAISPEELAQIYRTSGPNGGGDAKGATAEKRAALFVAAETEVTPLKKVRLIRSFLDDARRAGLYLTALRMIAPAAHSLTPAPEIGWFAETGVEIALAAGDYDTCLLYTSDAADE